MQKDCVIIVIINMEELRNHGTALTRSFTQPECAKIATLTTTTGKRG